MQAVCIDSNIVPARNASAKRHDDATAIFNAIDNGDLPRARLINYVVPEILYPLQKRISKSAAADTLDRLQSSRGFGFVYVSNSIHLHGEQLFRTYSFDDNFDVFGAVTRLTTATNCSIENAVRESGHRFLASFLML